MKNNFKGITLIALVITIIVLLILAGVSIAMLTGQNGILTQAQNAKERTTQSNAEEMVRVAIGGLQAENLGDTSKITPQMVADQVNEENARDDVTAEETTFPTNIVFNDDGVKVPVEVTLRVGDAEDAPSNPNYSVSVDETKIAPKELFKIEILTEPKVAKVASTTDGNISVSEQTKGTAKIAGIWPEYCNEGKYYGWLGDTKVPEKDTQYKIEYPGITDSLIIPYEVEFGGYIFTITEVDLRVRSSQYANTHDEQFTNNPRIENIIFPNTVTKIYMYSFSNYITKKIVLPENLTEICDNMFAGCEELVSINIPKSITKIGESAFYRCDKLSEITIPEDCTYVGQNVFGYWNSNQTIHVPFTKEEGAPSTWNQLWNNGNATIDYKEELEV